MVKTYAGIPINDTIVENIEVIVEFRNYKYTDEDKWTTVNLGSFTAQTNLANGISEEDKEHLVKQFRYALTSGACTYLTKASNSSKDYLCTIVSSPITKLNLLLTK